MRTVRSSTCLLEGGVVPGQGGCLSGGVWCLGGVHLPPVDRILDTRFWKHYLSATSFAGGKYLLRLATEGTSKFFLRGQ